MTNCAADHASETRLHGLLFVELGSDRIHFVENEGSVYPDIQLKKCCRAYLSRRADEALLDLEDLEWDDGESPTGPSFLVIAAGINVGARGSCGIFVGDRPAEDDQIDRLSTLLRRHLKAEPS